jgi:hypothetical protein
MTRHTTSAIRPAADVSGALEALRIEVAELRALVAERLPAPAPPPPERDWVTVSEAAVLVNRTPAAVRARCRARGIGVKAAGGEWRIDRARLLASGIDAD